MDDMESWLLLWRVPGIGCRHFIRLLGLFGTPHRALAASAAELADAGVSGETVRSILQITGEAIAADCRWLAAPNHHLVHLHDPRYPARLREIADPPPLLFVNGDPSCLSRPQLAIVGSRNATRAGADFALKLSAELASQGLTVTSGLAYGIDAAAHRGCLSTGQPTVAVTGTGPDRIYPRRNQPLAAEIVRSGAVVTEFPTGVPPQPENFPRRNRILSGLALGVVVVEATVKSGSLITARFALEQGREVFAVPGSVNNPNARGCHALLRQGAKLVETTDDIMEELGNLEISRWRTSRQGQSSQQIAGREVTEEQSLMLECMGFDPVSVDTLAQCTGLTPQKVSSILLTMELSGAVAAQPGGTFVKLRRETA